MSETTEKIEKIKAVLKDVADGIAECRKILRGEAEK